MNIQRIWAIVLRHYHLSFRDLNRLTWMFYWPVFDIITWGFAGFWVQQSSSLATIGSAQLAGLVLLQLVGRSGLEISLSMMEELWSMNMINIFASPLQLSEWISATFVLGLLSNTALFIYCAMVTWLVFGYSIFSLGLPLLLFIPPLIMSGACIGFIATTLIIYFGARVQTFVFILNWIFPPFCGVFYPVEILPPWAQAIAQWIPLTYVFKALHFYSATNTINWNLLSTGYIMSGIYMVLTMALFWYAFNQSKTKGFARLTAE